MPPRLAERLQRFIVVRAADLGTAKAKGSPTSDDEPTKRPTVRRTYQGR